MDHKNVVVHEKKLIYSTSISNLISLMMILLLIHIVVAFQTQIIILKTIYHFSNFHKKVALKCYMNWMLTRRVGLIACRPTCLRNVQLSWHHHWHISLQEAFNLAVYLFNGSKGTWCLFTKKVTSPRSLIIDQYLYYVLCQKCWKKIFITILLTPLSY